MDSQVHYIYGRWWWREVVWVYQIGVLNIHWHTLREIVQLERVEEGAGHMAGVLDNGLAVVPFAP